MIYFGWDAGLQYWLFTLYDKDECDDLDAEQLRQLKRRIKAELEARKRG